MKTMTTENTKTMTTAIIQYPLPPGAPIEAVKSGFLEVAPFSRVRTAWSESIFSSRTTARPVAACDVRAASNQERPLVNHAVVEPAGFLVVGVAALD